MLRSLGTTGLEIIQRHHYDVLHTDTKNQRQMCGLAKTWFHSSTYEEDPSALVDHKLNMSQLLKKYWAAVTGIGPHFLK